MEDRLYLKDKKRIVIKVGSSSIIHESTGGLDYTKLEKLIRIISDLKNQDKDVVLVSSGAIGVGAKVLGLQRKPRTTSLRQACASVGQGQLMMIYQKLFYEYHQIASQVLLTFDVISSQERRQNAINTFNELLQLDVIPVVNENDTVAIEEVDINFGDNDTLSAIVASMIHADLLLLLTDIDGLYTDDPRVNPNATLIPVVERIDDKIEAMAKGAQSQYGTGGMTTKIAAAKIATNSDSDMVILSGDDIGNISRVLNGENVGTLFKAYKEHDFDIVKYIIHKEYLEGV
jgi:glutamate 5-kinase